MLREDAVYGECVNDPKVCVVVRILRVEVRRNNGVEEIRRMRE